jgi:uncharacterized protein with PQ loop repeat
VLPYIPQYQSIKRTKKSDAFSSYVSLILIISNTLRVFFWLGKDFPIVLLLQSLVMIALQLLMVQVCVDTLDAPKKKELDAPRGCDWGHFWEWDAFSMYGKTSSVQFLSYFVIVVFFLTFCFEGQSLYFEILGYLSLGVESALGIPQFYKNLKRQSTDGLSLSMVVGWTVGDSLKTVYFVLRHVPSQFVLCGSLQICVDIVILGQFATYSSKTREYLPY